MCWVAVRSLFVQLSPVPTSWLCTSLAGWYHLSMWIGLHHQWLRQDFQRGRWRHTDSRRDKRHDSRFWRWVGKPAGARYIRSSCSSGHPYDIISCPIMRPIQIPALMDWDWHRSPTETATPPQNLARPQTPAPQVITSHHVLPYLIASHCISLHPVASHCISLHLIASRCIPLHPIASHCI